jgi:hypothetical protein
MLTEPIKQKIEDLFQSTPDYVGVGWGHKFNKEELTNEHSIVFRVPKKLPLSEIPEEEHLPSTVEIDGITYKTDVVEIGDVVPLSTCPSNTLNTCYTWTWFNYQLTPGGPIYPAGNIPPGNRGVIRPMKGGISITSANNVTSVGTLGFLAVDNAKNALVGVTNNHVVVGTAFYTNYRNVTNSNEYNDAYYQPGEGGFGGNSTYLVGEVVRYVPIVPQPLLNQVDGALVTIDPTKVTNAESYKLYGTNILTPMPFATTAEIDNLLVTNPPLISSGRSSGVKSPTSCGIKINAVNVNIPLSTYTNTQTGQLEGGYNINGSRLGASFSGTIEFIRTDLQSNGAPACPFPIYGGDSGSALAAQINGVWKIIGLVFAGSTYYGYANRIDQVAAQLNISAWDGTTKNYFDTSSRQYITTIGGSPDKTLTCASNIYWQVGTTSLTNPCP